MCHSVLQDPAFFRFLLGIDEELAAATHAGGCRFCGAPLHVANYPRKPRGCPAVVQEAYSQRLSFTCGRCFRRTTSPSVRFAGRRMYLAVVWMLLSPPGSEAAQELCTQLAIAPVTLKRWRRWWHEVFTATPFWHSVRERFVPPVAIAKLPHSLLERFDARESVWNRLALALRFLTPLSVPGAPVR